MLEVSAFAISLFFDASFANELQLLRPIDRSEKQDKYRLYLTMAVKLLFRMIYFFNSNNKEKGLP